MHLNETAFSDLNKVSETDTIKKQRQAAHSQGYDMSEPRKTGVGAHFTVDLTHRKTGERVTHPDGGSLGGSKEKSGRLDNTLRNRTKDAIKAHMTKIGRVDKRPAAKAKRKAEAAANKKRKAQHRDPFKRGKTYKEWVEQFG